MSLNLGVHTWMERALHNEWLHLNRLVMSMSGCSTDVATCMHSQQFLNNPAFRLRFIGQFELFAINKLLVIKINIWLLYFRWK